ncbi:MAG TPA: hypothetical protein VK660_01740 [Xanthomonadaceae bacterium]|nr:hypothetical protein [Xanthomonadaceae bacterium]
MNLFRSLASKSPQNRRDLLEPVLPPVVELAPQELYAPPPKAIGPSKADEMLRYLAERRKRI